MPVITLLLPQPPRRPGIISAPSTLPISLSKPPARFLQLRCVTVTSAVTFSAQGLLSDKASLQPLSARPAPSQPLSPTAQEHFQALLLLHSNRQQLPLSFRRKANAPPHRPGYFSTSSLSSPSLAHCAWVRVTTAQAAHTVPRGSWAVPLHSALLRLGRHPPDLPSGRAAPGPVLRTSHSQPDENNFPHVSSVSPLLRCTLQGAGFTRWYL